MFLRIALTWCVVAVVTTCGQAKADIILTNDEQTTVNSDVGDVTLYDASRAFIVSGGGANHLVAYNSSTVGMSGGQTAWLDAYDMSTVQMSGGDVSTLSTPITPVPCTCRAGMWVTTSTPTIPAR